MLLFSEAYKGGLPHAVFRTDYMSRLRSLLPSPGGADTPPDDVCGVTPTSVRRPHRLSQPKRLFPESVVRAPILTEQNPAEMIGETVIDCRPSLLPVSIPLSGLSPETISVARDCVSYLPSEETGQSIMNMVTPLQEVEASSCATVADYAPPAVPPVESVLESSGYTVPEDLGCSWMPDFVPGSDVTNTDEGGYLQSLREPLPPLTGTPPTAPMVAENTIQAALRLHHDASLIMTNIQIMSQLVTSFSRTASEVMRRYMTGSRFRRAQWTW